MVIDVVIKCSRRVGSLQGNQLRLSNTSIPSSNGWTVRNKIERTQAVPQETETFRSTWRVSFRLGYLQQRAILIAASYRAWSMTKASTMAAGTWMDSIRRFPPYDENMKQITFSIGIEPLCASNEDQSRYSYLPPMPTMHLT